MPEGSLKVSFIFSWVKVMFIGFQENFIVDELKPGSRCLFSAGIRVMKVFDSLISSMLKFKNCSV